jgi:peptide/nickel transport system permease protein
VYQVSYSLYRPIFPLVWDFFIYSSTVLFSAFTIAVVLALFVALIIFLLPESWIRKIRVSLFMLDSFPDVLVAIAVQFFVIWFFQKTNFLLFQVVSINGAKTYTLPIVCLVILPFMMCLRIVLLVIAEEYSKQYVETARSIGLKKFRILWRHVLPNALVSVFHHTKTILWFMLSNLFIIEYIFNIKGIMYFMMMTKKPEIFTICMLLMFVPMFLFFTAGRLITSKWEGERI